MLLGNPLKSECRVKYKEKKKALTEETEPKTTLCPCDNPPSADLKNTYLITHVLCSDFVLVMEYNLTVVRYFDYFRFVSKGVSFLTKLSSRLK